MSKRISGMLSLVVGALFLLALAPVARAQSVDERIKVLQQELMELKAGQQQVKEEQIELKKQATEAAAALPGFSYRPRNGLTITAADKSWSFNISSQFHVRMYNHTDGNDSHGTPSGKLFGRRITLMTNYCWQNCFYDFDLQIDMDQNNIPLELQRAQIQIHFEQLNPYLPMLRFGLDAAANKAHLTSSSSSARWERNTLNDDSSILVTGSHQGIGLVWSDIPVGPATFGLESHLVTGRLGAGDGQSTNSDRMSWQAYFGTKPFAKIKNKWLNGFEFRFEVDMESIDDRRGCSTSSANPRGYCAPVDLGGTGQGTFSRQRLRTDERIGRQVIIDTGNGRIGGGLHHFLQPGIIYRVGPYTLNALMAFSKWRGENDAYRGVNAFGWMVAHELYLWSPKGVFTGSASTPGSVLWGWNFNRSEMDCGEGTNCNRGGGSRFRQAHLLQREMNLWYTVINGLRVGMQWNWWESSNTPTNVQRAVNCSRNTSAGDGGKSCDWHTLNLTAAYNW